MPDFLKIELYITYAILGLLVGSFLNVCIYRLPRGKFLDNTRSYCPHCMTTLRWYELFPLFSYIFLKGRCRTCKEKISIRYPIVEVTNMIMWMLAMWLYRDNIPYAILISVFFSILIVMSMIDIDIKEIPNGIVIAILILGIISFFMKDGIEWWEKLIGLFAMSVPFLIIGIITGGLGGGDIKILFAAGLLLGWKLIILGGLIGVIIGGILGIVLIIVKHAGRKTEMPLGPSLAAGFAIALLFGPSLLNWYMSLFA